MKLKSLFWNFCLFLVPALAGEVTKYGRKPISLSTNNAGEYSDYIFQFTTQTDLLDSKKQFSLLIPTR